MKTCDHVERDNHNNLVQLFLLLFFASMAHPFNKALTVLIGF